MNNYSKNSLDWHISFCDLLANFLRFACKATLRLRDISQHLLETYYEKHKKGEISQITSNTSRVNISSIPYSGFFMFYICGYY